MAIDFPNSPTNGQTYTVGSFTWQYDGEKWIAANGITLDGLTDVTAPTPSSGDFLKWNGSAWVNDPINLGTDTTGNYVSDVTGGTGVTVTHTPGEGSSPSIAIGQAVGTSSSVQFAAVTAPLIGNVTGNSSTATSLQTARTISLTGDVSGSVSFDGTSNVSISATVQPNSVALGTDTTGNYMSGVTSGTGVTVTHTPAEGSSATIAIGQDVATSASVTFAQLTTTGDATISGNLTVSGTTTTINTETINLADNIIVLNSNETSTPSQNAGIEIERGTSTNVVLRWNETTDKWQFTNDGTNYTDLGAGGATISSTAPSSPEAGALWFDSDTAQTFVYYDSSWVEVGGAAGGARVQVLASAPSSPLQGTMWFNSDTGGTYVYYGSTWIEIGAAPANAILQAIDAKGDLIVGTADNTVDNLTVGSNNQILMADSSTATGLKWATSPETDLVTTKGDLLVGTAADTLARQGVGSNGQILIADSGQTNGIAWVDPLSNRNVIINGAMQVAQRNTSVASITTEAYYTADRFFVSMNSLGTWTQSVENDAPTGSGLRKSLKMLCTTADASPAASDYMIIGQKLEGQNLQQFLKGTASAKQFALSFWVKSNVTGTYIAELVDNDNSRAVSASYTISASATWEKKTIIFPADTTGAFDNDNASSLTLHFWMGSGTTYASGTLATTWGTTTSANRAVGVTNLASATNNYLQVTGVQLEAGAVATPFEFEDYGTTLAKCQRYYWRAGGDHVYQRYGMGIGSSSTVAYASVFFPVSMRAAPSSVESNLLLTFDGGSGASITSISINAAGKNSCDVQLGAASGFVQWRPFFLHANNSLSSYLAFSAEL